MIGTAIMSTARRPSRMPGRRVGVDTVMDAWLLHQVLTGSGGTHLVSETSLKGVTLGVPRSYFCDVMEPDVRARFDAAIQALEAEGTAIQEVDIPHAALTAAIYIHIHATEGSEYHARALERMPDRYTPMVRLRLEMSCGYLVANHAWRLLHNVSKLMGDQLPTFEVVRAI